MPPVVRGEIPKHRVTFWQLLPFRICDHVRVPCLTTIILVMHLTQNFPVPGSSWPRFISDLRKTENRVKVGSSSRHVMQHSHWKLGSVEVISRTSTLNPLRIFSRTQIVIGCIMRGKCESRLHVWPPPFSLFRSSHDTVQSLPHPAYPMFLFRSSNEPLLVFTSISLPKVPDICMNARSTLVHFLPFRPLRAT